MQVLGRTPKTDLVIESIAQKMYSFYRRWIDEEGWSPVALDTAMTKLCTLSARVVFDPQEVDFELVNIRDDTDLVEHKFRVYLDSASIECIEKAFLAIKGEDQRFNHPDLTPAAALGNDPNADSGGMSGKKKSRGSS